MRIEVFTQRCSREKAVRLQCFAKEPLRRAAHRISDYSDGSSIHRLFQSDVGKNRHSLSESHQSLPEGLCVIGKEIESRVEVMSLFFGVAFFELHFAVVR